MKRIKLLHAADLHLDSPFEGLTGSKAAQRRREQRELLRSLMELAKTEEVQLVLLSGDLLDSASPYLETSEELLRALGSVSVPVFIAPGNHDPYTPGSPYAKLSFPENVHIFKSGAIERVELRSLSCAVYGAAFTAAAQEQSLLEGFRAPEDGLTHLMVLHGDMSAAEARYSPLRKEQIERSNLDYLALGHTHLHDGFHKAGKTTYAYAGCPEGRGFDELGDKGILCGTVEPGKAELRFVPFAHRRYEILCVDVTGKNPADALRSSLPESTARDLYRVVFTGETDERGIDLKALEERFAPDFFRLELRDRTRIKQDVWARSGEDSLRGLFLRELRAKYEAAAEESERTKIEQAVRFGLAALDGRDL